MKLPIITQSQSIFSSLSTLARPTHLFLLDIKKRYHEYVLDMGLSLMSNTALSTVVDIKEICFTPGLDLLKVKPDELTHSELQSTSR